MGRAASACLEVFPRTCACRKVFPHICACRKVFPHNCRACCNVGIVRYRYSIMGLGAEGWGLGGGREKKGLGGREKEGLALVFCHRCVAGRPGHLIPIRHAAAYPILYYAVLYYAMVYHTILNYTALYRYHIILCYPGVIHIHIPIPIPHII